MLPPASAPPILQIFSLLPPLFKTWTPMKCPASANIESAFNPQSTHQILLQEMKNSQMCQNSIFQARARLSSKHISANLGTNANWSTKGTQANQLENGYWGTIQNW